jgi:hypothetical protein
MLGDKVIKAACSMLWGVAGAATMAPFRTHWLMGWSPGMFSAPQGYRLYLIVLGRGWSLSTAA